MTAPGNKGQHEDIEMSNFSRPAGTFAMRLLACSTALALLSACDKPFDMDLRGNFGNSVSTADAARAATAPRPKPDNRGIISYPGYQVAVAQRGDTVGALARRIGADPEKLARHNGVQTGDTLRQGEVMSLPNRVAEPSAATGAFKAPNSVDITTLAGGAIDKAGDQKVATTTLASAPKPQVGAQPVRHKVERGETAYTVSRLYGVSVRSLSEWNGLGSDFAIREGQYLLIPVAKSGAPTTPRKQTPRTTPTPIPPSAKTPLPAEKTTVASAAKPKVATPNLSQAKATSGGKLGYPVQGKIIRAYTKGKNDGIDISAASGTAVRAAESGTVAAITSDADQVPIIVVKHPNNLLTVYANVDDIKVSKGDKVSRGQQLAAIRKGASNYVHFEVRKGFDSVDPQPYLK